MRERFAGQGAVLPLDTPEAFGAHVAAETERWGALYVWESKEASEQELPSRARELIGKDPEIIEIFDLEATVSVAPELARLGLAFD